MTQASAAEFTHASSTGLDISAPAGLSLRFLLSCCLLLMMVTFSPTDRDLAVTSGALDVVAMVKTAVRAFVLAGLTLFLVRTLSSSRIKAVFRVIYPWLLFAAWAVASTVWSPLKSVSLGQSASLVILLMLAWGIAITTRASDMECVLKTITLGLLALCILLLTIYVALPDWKCMSRSGHGLMHATNSSATASIGFVTLIACRTLYGWKWCRKLFVPGSLIFGATLILAQSRTALGVTILTTGCLSLVLAPPLWRALGIAAVGLLGTLYLAIDLEVDATDTIVAELSTYLARGQTVEQMAQLSGREEMWTAMWESFNTSPWIGHGYFVSSATGELYVWYTWTNWTAHNFWLQLLVTTGIVGCACMAWAMIRLALNVFTAVRQGTCEWQFGALLGTVMCWQLGWGVNNESFAGPLQPESVVYLVLLGVAAGRLAAEKSRLDRKPTLQTTISATS